MSKAILVIDMPESCEKCPLFHGFYTDMICGANNKTINYPYPKDFRQAWCPLKSVKLKKIKNVVEDSYDGGLKHGFVDGWNAYFDEIINK